MQVGRLASIDLVKKKRCKANKVDLEKKEESGRLVSRREAVAMEVLAVRLPLLPKIQGSNASNAAGQYKM